MKLYMTLITDFIYLITTINHFLRHTLAILRNGDSMLQIK